MCSENTEKEAPNCVPRVEGWCDRAGKKRWHLHQKVPDKKGRGRVAGQEMSRSTSLRFGNCRELRSTIIQEAAAQATGTGQGDAKDELGRPGPPRDPGLKPLNNKEPWGKDKVFFIHDKNNIYSWNFFQQESKRCTD